MIKIYPKDQVRFYLIVDVISFVFLFSIVLSSSSALTIYARVTLLILYLIAFYMALWNRDWRLYLATLLGLSVIAVLTIYEGTMMLTFGFVFADLVGRAKSRWQILAAMVFIFLNFVMVLGYQYGWRWSQAFLTMIPIMIIQTLYPALIYYIKKTKGLQVELTSINKQLVQQEERHRIARDLHDTLGHTLTIIKLKTELTTKWVDHDSDRVKHELNEILTTTRTALKQVRELVSEMNEISLRQEMLQCKQLLQINQISTTILSEHPHDLLSSFEETMLSLCVREATTNILKHSRAEHCYIHTQFVEQMFQLEIIDDGYGFTTQGWGSGLPSMKERMHAIKGTATIYNRTEGGTMLSLKVPIQLHRKVGQL
ncbi:sensor histidine kinase [Hazenella sp. IB182353]|uniref:sensor histidine kinase n=1 Tax=Polycladospora coralii TaxID=2771432 RepID=UPI0017469DCC|nr:sensor histidine kinase [Polycladospora coralii]MBS7531966.1 sensor histidine kinase [Polycladospora coralii]